ncbi:putative cinnamoyl-CoA reductase [Xylaria sp. CBS 124048]|nr:putative cinnamoyl-CoA reductase [Xylaria sp. CBS 124048]
MSGTPATILITGATGLIGFATLVVTLKAGHTVRFTARNTERAAVVLSNPVVQALSPGARLEPVIIPDLSTPGSLDGALNGVTHILHIGSPVPRPAYDAYTDIFIPTLEMCANVLSAALHAPTIKRVVITNSILGNIPPNQDLSKPVLPSDRIPVSGDRPTAVDEQLFPAYTVGKRWEHHETEAFIRTHKPAFSVCHIMPGYVFGRNELALDAEMMTTSPNSSNAFLMMGMLGQETPISIHGGYAHVEDLAELHLRLALLDDGPGGKAPVDMAISPSVDYDTVFDIVAKHFPKAVQAGVFTRGKIHQVPVAYDSTEAERLLGGLRSFERAVVDVAAQYLEKIGVEKE